MKIKKKSPAPDKFLSCERYANITFQEFSDKIGRITNKKLRGMYLDVFGRPCTCDLVWAKYQIQYELARQADIKAGNLARLAKGTPFRNSYEGTMACDLSKTSETLRTMIPFEQKEKIKENNTMKKENKIAAIKKAVEAKKSKCIGITLGLSVYATWVHIFEQNEKKRWTDDKITEFLLAEFPDHQIKSFHAVQACRGYYNQGRFTNGAKPEVRSIRYNEAGEPFKRIKAKGAEEAKKPAIKAKSAKSSPVKKPVAVKKAVTIKKSTKKAAK